MGQVSSPDSCSRSKGGFSGFGTVQYKLLKNNYFDELIGEEIKSYREIFGTKFTGLSFSRQISNEEGSMWLALASIVLASAIGFNVLALWLTGWFGRNESESAFSQRNTNAELSPDWAPSERLSTFC
jgi:hypothetical protein